MAEGATRERWNHTALIAALIYNTHRSSRAPALSPADFHPSARRVEPIPAGIEALKVFLHDR